MASGWTPNFGNGYSSNENQHNPNFSNVYSPNNENPHNPNSNQCHQNVCLSGGYGSRVSSYPSTSNIQQHFPHQQQQQAYYPPQHTPGYPAQLSSGSSQAGGQQRTQRRPGDWDWEEIVEDEFRKEIGKMATEAQQKHEDKK